MKNKIQMERKAFEDAICAERYDGDLRKVFADWLEEHGFDDEAVVQRAWTPEKQEAEDWLLAYAEQCDLSYQQLIEATNDFLEKGRGYTLGVDTPDIVFESAVEFWERFATATGRTDAEKHRGATFFRCAC